MRQLFLAACVLLLALTQGANAQSLNLRKVDTCGTGNYNTPFLTVDATGTLCTGGGGGGAGSITTWGGATLAAATAWGVVPSGNVIGANVNILAGLQPNGPATVANSPAVNIASDQIVPIQGSVASGVAASGNPLRMGCDVTSTQPTLTAGTNAPCQLTTRGNLFSSLYFNNQPIVGVATNVQTNNAAETSTNAMATAARNYLWNSGTNSYDLWTDDPGAGGGVGRVVAFPTNSSTGGITPTVTGAAANNLVIKASAGNLYSVFAANQTATAGFLVLLNATTAPADGAITPLDCAALPASGNATITYQVPSVFSTGITAIVTSAASCFTKTTGVITAFIRGSAK